VLGQAVEGADLKGVSLEVIFGFEFDILFHFGSGGRDFGPLGLLACLGAGGGLSAPAVYSKMGRNRSMTLCRSANACPLSRGIQVPERQC
jgi:hypothetical protein